MGYLCYLAIELHVVDALPISQSPSVPHCSIDGGIV